MRAGLIAVDLLVGSESPFTYSDINLLVLPGFSALGLKARLVPVTELDTLRSQVVAASLTFEAMPPAMPDEPDLEPEAVLELTRDPKVLSAAPGRVQVDPELNLATFVLLLQRAPSGHRSQNLTAALMRWSAFASACPERLFTQSDSVHIAGAVQFLEEIVGQSQSPMRTRLRRAIAALRNREISDAFRWIREAALIAVDVPDGVREALLCPADVYLTDIERRDLIYVARSGSAELKTLAVARLAAERERSDARNTLAQLRWDDCYWVRKAAARGIL